jgi:ubiquinone/menaquinone biosynthesis C-methylase UbiE
MNFTGERYLPTERGQIKYEHLHRYAACLPLVAGRNVLDIACGEGYGAAMLARTATTVTGIDLAVEAVEHAQTSYRNQANLRFLTGDCAAIPLPDHVVEVVTSFETIEHHNQHEEMLRELKRVLTPGGLLILSSPNKLVYSDQANYQNPFHVKELYHEELLELLARHFRHTRIFGQKLMTASFLSDLRPSETPALTCIREDAQPLQRRWLPLSAPPYFVTLSSDDPAQLEQSLESFYLDDTDDLHHQMHTDWIADRRALMQMIRELEAQNATLHSNQTQLETLEAQNATLYSNQTRLETEVARLETEVARLEIEVKTIQTRLEAEVTMMQASRAWQLVQKWWRLRALFRIAPGK